jgi:hypothetical protein
MILKAAAIDDPIRDYTVSRKGGSKCEFRGNIGFCLCWNYSNSLTQKFCFHVLSKAKKI